MPLSAIQLRAFPAIKDMSSSGKPALPGYAIAGNFHLQEDKMKEAISQLIDVYLLLCVQKGNHFKLVDFVKFVSNPNLAHELLTLEPAAQSG